MFRNTLRGQSTWPLFMHVWLRVFVCRRSEFNILHFTTLQKRVQSRWHQATDNWKSINILYFTYTHNSDSGDKSQPCTWRQWTGEGDLPQIQGFPDSSAHLVFEGFWAEWVTIFDPWAGQLDKWIRHMCSSVAWCSTLRGFASHHCIPSPLPKDKASTAGICRVHGLLTRSLSDNSTPFNSDFFALLELACPRAEASETSTLFSGVYELWTSPLPKC